MLLHKVYDQYSWLQVLVEQFLQLCWNPLKVTWAPAHKTLVVEYRLLGGLDNINISPYLRYLRSRLFDFEDTLNISIICITPTTPTSNMRSTGSQALLQWSTVYSATASKSTRGSQA